MSGIYNGPGGQKLHGDGKSVGSPRSSLLAEAIADAKATRATALALAMKPNPYGYYTRASWEHTFGTPEVCKCSYCGSRFKEETFKCPNCGASI